jgi:hypothetical protein
MGGMGRCFFLKVFFFYVTKIVIAAAFADF